MTSLVVGSNVRGIETMKWKLVDKCQMSDLGDVSLVLGMQVNQDGERRTLTITQEEHTKHSLARFGMKHCSSVRSCPRSSRRRVFSTSRRLRGTKLSQGPHVSSANLTVRYDVHMQPAKVHMGMAKHLLRYLAGRTAFSMTYERGGFTLTAFLDSYWGNHPDNGKSTTAYLIIMAKGLVSFKTGVQSLTAMPTMEAELMASALTMK